MTKTLKITTILTAAAVLGIIVVLASQGIASDKEIEKFLNTPGIAEQLQSGSVEKSSGEQETPLIRQARAFSLRINPPPPPAPVRTTPQPRQQIRPKVEVSAKFKLVGTSYHTGDERNSWALIDEVGKGWHWVRPGEKIEYLTVEKIGDGVVLIRDGQRSYELATEKTQKPDFVKSFSGDDTDERIIPSWQGQQDTVTQAVAEEKPEAGDTENVQPAEDMDVIKRQQVEENIKWLKQLQENPQSLGMTEEEANELGSLGEFLKTVTAELPVETNEPDNEPQINEPVTEPNQAVRNIGPRGLRSRRKR